LGHLDASRSDITQRGVGSNDGRADVRCIVHGPTVHGSLIAVDDIVLDSLCGDAKTAGDSARSCKTCGIGAGIRTAGESYGPHCGWGPTRKGKDRESRLSLKQKAAGEKCW